MKLYFLRHAEAEDGEDDDVRPLSVKGREQCRLVGRFLRRAGVRFDAVYSSPLVRAKDTAALVLNECGGPEGVGVELVDVLGFASASRGFDGWLRDLPLVRHCLLVGHAPTLAAHVRRMTGVADESGFRLSKAALACVDTEDRRRGRLKFLVTPRLLENLL